MTQMTYVSTRGSAPEATFEQVLLEGLASDGGLFVPTSNPDLRGLIKAYRGLSYQEIMYSLLRQYGCTIPEVDLKRIIAEAYSPAAFSSSDVVRLTQLARNFFLCDTSSGPSLAFKDIALRLVAGLMNYVLNERNEYLNILAATSGDTGSAAAMAVDGMERMRLHVLSPKGRMSEVQRMQMYRTGAPNVHNYVMHRDFDFCQAVVKEINADSGFKREFSIGAMNSINWVRILAQVCYYVFAYTRVTTDSDAVMTAVVPSGNFGNALAAYIASRALGNKIRVVVATNENDILHKFFSTGRYATGEVERVKSTFSPSMDIGEASNLERLFFDAVGQDPEVVKGMMQEVKAQGYCNCDLKSLPVQFASCAVSEEETLMAIRNTFLWYDQIIDPHTAVAMQAGFDGFEYRKDGPVVVFETAKPAKFPDTIDKALGMRPAVPARICSLEGREDDCIQISCEKVSDAATQVKGFIRNFSRQ